MNYDTLVHSHVYGFELYYRIEYRTAPTSRPPPESESTDTMGSDVHLDNYIPECEEKDTRPTLIISYRKEIDGVLKMLYEAPPISGKEVVKWLDGSKTESPELNDLPTETKRKFVTGFIGRELEIGDANKKLNKDQTAKLKKQREERQQRRKDIEELTLGIMLLADEKLLDLSDDDKQIIPKLIECAGSMLWREAIPEKFLWLVNSSERERKQVKRIMRKFFYEQTNAGVFETNPWLDYDASPNRKKQINSKAYTQKYVEVASLSEEQCLLIIKKCKQRLEAKSANGIDIAVLLMLTLSMDEYEICAINLEDFNYLKSYDYMLTVTVTHEIVKAKSKYIRREISDPYQSRTLPLICLIRDCWELIRKKQKIGYRDKTQHPLVPLRINKERRATPAILVDEITKYVNSIDGILLRKVTSREDISIPDICELLKNTAFQKMHDVHLEEEEIRAVLGRSPKRVSGKHYYDRHNEGAINKIGSLIDKWTKSVEMKHFLNGHYLLGTNRRRELIIAAEDAVKCMQASIVVEFDRLSVEQIPDDGVELEICAFGGMRGAVENKSMKKDESNV